MTGTPRLAQCPRCSAYVLLAHTAGLAVAVDVGAVDTQRFADAVVRRVGLWWVDAAADGTPGRLRAPVGPPRPSWTLQGAQTGAQRLHAEHSCGALAQDMRPVPVKGADTGPRQASATSGAPVAGNHPPAVLAGAGASTLPSRAPSANHRRSEPLGRCGICGRPIHEGVQHWSITHGSDFIYGEHEECP